METKDLHKLTSHAYILYGPDKEEMRAYARQRIEEWQGPDPVHPDVVWLRRDKATVIPVGEVRERVVDDIAIRPYREPYKIYVIEDAELLGAAAQKGVITSITSSNKTSTDLPTTNAITAYVDGKTAECNDRLIEPNQ